MLQLSAWSCSSSSSVTLRGPNWDSENCTEGHLFPMHLHFSEICLNLSCFSNPVRLWVLLIFLYKGKFSSVSCLLFPSAACLFTPLLSVCWGNFNELIFVVIFVCSKVIVTKKYPVFEKFSLVWNQTQIQIILKYGNSNKGSN